jgi:hypothetical protein
MSAYNSIQNQPNCSCVNKIKALALLVHVGRARQNHTVRPWSGILVSVISMAYVALNPVTHDFACFDA